MRGWFGKLPPSAVQIWRLEPRDPRMGRRISFEVPQASWPAWLQPDAGLGRDERCGALYHALLGHGVGRPRPADAQGATDGLTRSRHDFEFLFPRRPEQYTAMVLMGTVADLTEARFAELLWWIDAPLPATPGSSSPGAAAPAGGPGASSTSGARP